MINADLGNLFNKKSDNGYNGSHFSKPNSDMLNGLAFLIFFRLPLSQIT